MKEDISGRACYAGEIVGRWREGQGATFDPSKGRVFVGEFVKSKLKAGVMSYLN